MWLADFIGIRKLRANMLIFLVHIRDPQFYALPATTRAKNGNIRVMGFPPIGIMSLSSVLKRAGHECVMFDQANPETPNEVIVEAIRRQKPVLVGLSFLSTTSYPYAKILSRQIRAADDSVKLAFGGVFATLNEVLDFYDDAPENPNVGRREVDRLVRQLDDPDDEAQAIIEFLKALNDDGFDKTIPARVPSGLTPGGRIQ